MTAQQIKRTYRMWQRHDSNLAIITVEYVGHQPYAASDLRQIYPETHLKASELHFDRRNLVRFNLTRRHWRQVYETTGPGVPWHEQDGAA